MSALVEGLLVETDRETRNAAVGPGGHSGDQTRVDPATQKQSNRDVGCEAGPDGPIEDLTQLLHIE